MRSLSIATAVSPSAAIGWTTVVRLGRRCRPSWMPSNPVTATSPGTLSPASRSAAMAPIAIWSFAHIRARGTRLVAMICSATWRPPAVVKSPR
jgi:hypothetical protein